MASEWLSSSCLALLYGPPRRDWQLEARWRLGIMTLFIVLWIRMRSTLPSPETDEFLNRKLKHYFTQMILNVK